MPPDEPAEVSKRPPDSGQEGRKSILTPEERAVKFGGKPYKYLPAPEACLPSQRLPAPEAFVPYDTVKRLWVGILNKQPKPANLSNAESAIWDRMYEEVKSAPEGTVWGVPS